MSVAIFVVHAVCLVYTCVCVCLFVLSVVFNIFWNWKFVTYGFAILLFMISLQKILLHSTSVLFLHSSRGILHIIIRFDKVIWKLFLELVYTFTHILYYWLSAYSLHFLVSIYSRSINVCCSAFQYSLVWHFWHLLHNK